MGAHSSFFVGLLDHDDIGELSGILDFTDEVGFKELVYFLSDYFA